MFPKVVVGAVILMLIVVIMSACRSSASPSGTVQPPSAKPSVAPTAIPIPESVQRVLFELSDDQSLLSLEDRRIVEGVGQALSECFFTGSRGTYRCSEGRWYKEAVSGEGRVTYVTSPMGDKCISNLTFEGKIPDKYELLTLRNEVIPQKGRSVIPQVCWGSIFVFNFD